MFGVSVLLPSVKGRKLNIQEPFDVSYAKWGSDEEKSNIGRYFAGCRLVNGKYKN